MGNEIKIIRGNDIKATMSALMTPGIKAVFSDYLCGCCGFGEDLIWTIKKSDAKVIGGTYCGSTCHKEVEEAGKVFALLDKNVNDGITIDQVIENAIAQKISNANKKLANEITGLSTFSLEELANAKALNVIKELSFYSDYGHYDKQPIYFNSAPAKGFAIVDDANNVKGFAKLKFGLGSGQGLEYTSPIAKLVEKEFLEHGLHLDLSSSSIYRENMWLDIAGKMEGFPNSKVPGTSWYVYNQCNGKTVRYSLHGSEEAIQSSKEKLSNGLKEIKLIPNLIKSKILG